MSTNGWIFFHSKRQRKILNIYSDQINSECWPRSLVLRLPDHWQDPDLRICKILAFSFPDWAPGGQHDIDIYFFILKVFIEGTRFYENYFCQAHLNELF